jgi:hypothetical protein
MDGWWGEVEAEILACLREQGSTSTAVIARHLKMSEAAAISLLALLAGEGKLRIEAVGPVGPARRVPPAHSGARYEGRAPLNDAIPRRQSA